jgi:type I restriction-modification system DNA methylase subunit
MRNLGQEPITTERAEARAESDRSFALTGHLFYGTQIPVCLWFLAKNRHDGDGIRAARTHDRRKHDCRMNPKSRFPTN